MAVHNASLDINLSILRLPVAMLVSIKLVVKVL